MPERWMAEEHDKMLKALTAWAKAYVKAQRKHGTRYPKPRDTELLAVCEALGLVKYKPEPRPKLTYPY